MERVRHLPCPRNNSQCKYKDTSEGCHLSEHHLYPRRLGRAVFRSFSAGEATEAEAITAKRYIEHPLNRVLSCRMIHDELDKLTPDVLPPEPDMRRFLEVNRD